MRTPSPIKKYVLESVFKEDKHGNHISYLYSGLVQARTKKPKNKCVIKRVLLTTN